MRFWAPPHPVSELAAREDATFGHIGSIFIICNLHFLDHNICILIQLSALNQDVIRLDVGVYYALLMERLDATQRISKNTLCDGKRDTLLDETKEMMREVIVDEQRFLWARVCGHSDVW